jgi:hypothetical protein
VLAWGGRPPEPPAVPAAAVTMHDGYG